MTSPYRMTMAVAGHAVQIRNRYKICFFLFIIGMYVRTLSQKQQQDTSFVTKRKSCCFITELYLIKTTRVDDIDTINRIDLSTGCARMHQLYEYEKGHEYLLAYIKVHE